MVFLKIFLWLFLVFLSSFVLWRRIKDDYPEEQAIRLVGLTTMTAILGSKLFSVLLALFRNNFVYAPAVFATHLEVYGAIVGGFIIGVYFHWEAKRWWGDYLDGLVEAVLWATGGGILIRLITIGFSVNYVGTYVSLVMIVIGLGILYVLRKHYRRFYWYKSGRVGFVFWSILALMGLSRLGLLYWESSQWGGYLLLGMHLLVLVSAIIGLYKLSGRVWDRDIDDLIHGVQNVPVRLNQSKRKWTHK